MMIALSTRRRWGGLNSRGAGGPSAVHVPNAAARYSLTGIPVGHEVVQDDAIAMVVSGTARDGTWYPQGLYGDCPFYNFTPGENDPGAGIQFSNLDPHGPVWQFNDEEHTFYSPDDVATPDLCTHWYNAWYNQVLVTGAGSTEVNEAFNRTNTTNGKPDYQGTGSNRIYWTGTAWRITDGLIPYYVSSDDVAEAWQVTTWNKSGKADNPLPTVIHGSDVPASITVTAKALTYRYTGPMDTLSAMIVSGSTLDGAYTRRGTYGGADFYNLSGSFDSTGNSVLVLDGVWQIYDTNNNAIYYNPSSAIIPPTSGWLNASDNSLASITVTAGTAPNIAGYFVSGGTLDGIYTDRHNSTSYRGNFTLLGVDSSGDTFGSLYWDGQSWTICDVDGSRIYTTDPYSVFNSGAATPDLAADWRDQDNNAVSLTITPVTQGELDAGVTVSGAGEADANATRLVSPLIYRGFPSYGDLDVAATRKNPLPDDGQSHWRVQALNGNYFGPLAAIPWQTTFAPDDAAGPAPTVTRNDIAAPANWEVVA